MNTDLGGGQTKWKRRKFNKSETKWEIANGNQMTRKGKNSSKTMKTHQKTRKHTAHAAAATQTHKKNYILKKF